MCGVLHQKKRLKKKRKGKGTLGLLCMMLEKGFRWECVLQEHTKGGMRNYHKCPNKMTWGEGREPSDV